MLFRSSIVLMALLAPTAVTAVGTSKTILESVDAGQTQGSYAVVTKIVASGVSGGTAQVVVETSWSGSDWVTVATGVAVSANGTQNATIALAAPQALGPFVRCRLVCTATIQVDACDVRLVCTRKISAFA